MTDRKPTVSCIITTRNRKDVVTRAIESVLGQNYPLTELILIDDASSDQTFEYLSKRYADHPKVLIFRNTEQLGPSAARNKGLEFASGEYVCFLDDDDQWLPQKIEKQMAHAMQGYDFVTMSRAKYAINDQIKSDYGPQLKKVTLKDLFGRNVIISVSPLVKTALMRQTPFDPILWCGEDYDVWIRLLKADVKTININEPLMILHKTTGNSLNKMRKNKLKGRRQIYIKHRELMAPRERMRFHLMTLLKFILPDPRYHQKRIQGFLSCLLCHW